MRFAYREPSSRRASRVYLGRTRAGLARLSQTNVNEANRADLASLD